MILPRECFLTMEIAVNNLSTKNRTGKFFSQSYLLGTICLKLYTLNMRSP